MRLWHERLIPLLPRAQLLGQHRECCALRGGGWGKPHATVNYVFTHPFEYLVQYHGRVMAEMQRRGYNVSPEWTDDHYRGRQTPTADIETSLYSSSTPIYPEHDEAYLTECLENLHAKGIVLPRP